MRVERGLRWQAAVCDTRLNGTQLVLPPQLQTRCLTRPRPSPRRLFPQPWPREVVLAWSVAGSVFAVVFGIWCWRYYVLGKRGPAVRRSQRLKSQ